LPAGYRIITTRTFEPGPALRLLREHLPTALYAVEEVGVGFRLSAPFPDGELDGKQILVPFEDLLHTPATRVIVRSTEHTPEDFLELTARIGIHGVSYFVGWTAWLDLAPDGVSKAVGLEQVRELLDVDPAATMAVGDGRNDLEMFAWAAHSVAMGQSVPEVLAAADEVVPSVDEDGLVTVLNRLLDC
jgi:hydroxymethylpyrimidine pyrophosphatase-like HAD family hydrolase